MSKGGAIYLFDKVIIFYELQALQGILAYSV